MSMLPALKTIECGEGRTKQKVGVEHDINKIVAKYKRTGQLPVLTDDKGQFVDTTTVGDYQACLEIVRNAHEMFHSYPSEFRRRFDNSPEKFLAYVEELPKNPHLIDEAVKLGIIEKPVSLDNPTTVNKDDTKAGS